MWCGCCSLLVLSASLAHPSDGVIGYLRWRYTACQHVWRLAGWAFHSSLLFKKCKNIHCERQFFFWQAVRMLD